MEKNNVDTLIEEGKKQLVAVQAELEKLATTAEQIVGVKAEEVTEQAQTLFNETKTKIDAKTKEVTETEEFKRLEADGKKAFNDAEAALNELSQDLTTRFSKFFGGK